MKRGGKGAPTVVYTRGGKEHQQGDTHGGTMGTSLLPTVYNGHIPLTHGYTTGCTNLTHGYTTGCTNLTHGCMYGHPSYPRVYVRGILPTHGYTTGCTYNTLGIPQGAHITP